MNKIMMLKGGSPAIHKLGNIGREVDNLIRIHNENDEYYIGNFEEGFGFIDVKFKKTDCRPLTSIEREKLNGSWYGINGQHLYKIYVDEESNVVNGKVTTIKGVIEKITDLKGNDKHNQMIGLNVEFGEDIQLGRSIVMLSGQGCITTSSVTDIIKGKEQYIIDTLNSIYYINIT